MYLLHGMFGYIYLRGDLTAYEIIYRSVMFPQMPSQHT